MCNLECFSEYIYSEKNIWKNMRKIYEKIFEKIILRTDIGGEISSSEWKNTQLSCICIQAQQSSDNFIESLRSTCSAKLENS